MKLLSNMAAPGQIENKWAIIAFYVRSKCHRCVWYQNVSIFFFPFFCGILILDIYREQKHGTQWKLTNQGVAFWQESYSENV